MFNNLKNQKGITLISLIVYVIVMLMIITIIGTITSYFYSNVNNQYEEAKEENTEAILDMYITKDIKDKEIIITTLDSEEIPALGSKTIKFEYPKDDTSIVYTITNDGIYRNYVKIYNIENNADMKFQLGEKTTSTNNSKIYENRELQICVGEEIFKTYGINIKPKAIYQ